MPLEINTDDFWKHQEDANAQQTSKKIAELRTDLAAAKERERTNDILLEQQGDKLAALNDELAAAKAEIETKTRELAQEVYYANQYRVGNNNLQKDLAARDLVIKQLREAVYWLKLKTDPKYGYPIAEKALTLQPTTEALDAYVQRAKEEVRDKCAAKCKEQYPYSVHHTDQLAAKNCAEAIKGMEL